MKKGVKASLAFGLAIVAVQLLPASSGGRQEVSSGSGGGFPIPRFEKSPRPSPPQ